MAATLSHVTGLLDAAGLKYATRDEYVLISFTMDRYTDASGDKTLKLIVQLENDGRYFKLFAPKAFVAAGEHADAFLRAATIVQWRTKLIQFEFDPSDGEVRPIVEFPLEDAVLTQAQLEMCIRGLVSLMDQYYEPLHRAITTGEVEFDDGPAVGALSETLSRYSPEEIAEALRLADERRRGEA